MCFDVSVTLPHLESFLCFDLKTANIIMGYLNSFISYCGFNWTLFLIISKPELDDEYCRWPLHIKMYTAFVILCIYFLIKGIFEMCLLIKAIKEEDVVIIKMSFAFSSFNFLIATTLTMLYAPVENVFIVFLEHLYLVINMYSILLSDSYCTYLCQTPVECD